MSIFKTARVILSLFASILAMGPATAQTPEASDQSGMLNNLGWRFVGPMIGGRVNAVVGHPTNKTTFYAGYTGGGVWMTPDAGSNWFNISDGYFKTGSVGAIDVSRTNPNVIYVGTGEHALRGDVSHGDGVYKSVDGGKSWTNVGLKETRQIPRIIIHPKNPDIVYVAALGHFAGPNPERGVFRTEDGGETWEKILFQDEHAGVIDLVMDRERPNLLYAATWEVQRFPWGIRSGGEGSRIYRSKDGGDSWEEITENPGLPRASVRERIGLAVTEAQPGRVYALISSDAGKGLYRSDDGGDSWKFMTDDIRLFARAYYYMHLQGDPNHADRVYVLAEELFRSDDGGATFMDVNDLSEQNLPSDHHDLWIDPDNSDIIVDGQDHGALVSVNGGKTWSPNHNQPTAQVYTLTTDNQFPYWLHGTVQDWGSFRVSSRPRGWRNGGAHEYETISSEGGYIALDPDNPNELFVSNHHWMHHVDLSAETSRYISPSDDLHYGWGTADQKYRFFWVFPVIRSAHSGALYAGSQYLHKSTDKGESWRVISPDLTAAEPETLEKTPLRGRDTSDNGPYWGPLTRDSNGDNWNATLYTVAESPLRKGLIWTGSDDGKIHITRNDGRDWQDVTPPDLPPRTIVSRIDPSPFDEGGAYVAATRYKIDDMSPYIYKTSDYGKTWTKITKGIAADDFVRVVRADPVRPGLLFAGTETGVFYSMDDGAQWTPLQSNLPHTPVHDMQVKEGDLVVATHGRGFWILDDITFLRQMEAAGEDETVLYKPRDSARYRSIHGPAALASPQTYGATINYFLASETENVELRFFDSSGELIRAFSDAPAERGINRFVWADQRYPGAEELKGHPTRSSRKIGPLALPGEYTVELVVDGKVHKETFSLLPNPRARAEARDLRDQFEFVISIRDTITDINRTVLAIRDLRTDLHSRAEVSEEIARGVALLDEKLYDMEDILTAYTVEYRMQYHAMPIKLDDKLYNLARRVNAGVAAPTRSQTELFGDYLETYDTVKSDMARFLAEDLRAFNDALSAAGADTIETPSHLAQ